MNPMPESLSQSVATVKDSHMRAFEPITLPALPVRTTATSYSIANYPPVWDWSAREVPCLLQALAQPPGPQPAGLYLHLPFCRQRTHHCSLQVYPGRNEADVGRYLDALLAEFHRYRQFPALGKRAFSSVYIGGGSPSYLSAKQIHRLLNGLHRHDNWQAVEECTFECEPGTVTAEKLQTLKSMGVTRLSIGFQSLNDDILRRNGHVTTVNDNMAVFQMARETGFKEINAALIAGLPGENERTWNRTIDLVLELVPDCVTIHQFELAHNSAVNASIKAGRQVRLPTWSLKRALVQRAFETLEQAGYSVVNNCMAVRNPERWRSVYTAETAWRGGDVLALGETAVGCIAGVQYRNLDSYHPYIHAVEDGVLPVRRAHRLTAEEMLRREVILQLKTGCLRADYFWAKFGVDLLKHFEPQWEQVQECGLAETDGKHIRLTRKGLLCVDWFLPAFYLPEHRNGPYAQG
jgi:oxygen-independent coproporphyrinogen-3 oxidase